MGDRKYPARSNVKQKILPNQEFLASLASLLCQSTGSVYLTQKRLPSHADTGITAAVTSVIDSATLPTTDENETTGSFQLLFRATNGKDEKFSTRVSSQDAGPFMEKYAEVCRAGMGAGLKKRDRKKVKKAPR